MDEELLRSESIAEAEAFIAVTGHDEDNLMASLLAKSFEIPKIITKISRFTFPKIIGEMGLDNIVNPKLITSSYITRFVRAMDNAQGNPVNALYNIVEGQAEAIEFTVGESARMIGIPIKSLKLKENVILGAISRRSETIVPHGNDQIHAKDTVVVITRKQTLTDLNDILDDDFKK
jgi:trk system potassium uptake protein TrkA